MTTVSNYREIYISVDIEATGPVPGRYSMSSLGAFAAGALTRDGEYVKFNHEDPANTFYVEFMPISTEFDPAAIKVGLLDGFDTSLPDEDGSRRHEWMINHGTPAKAAIQSFGDWVTETTSAHGKVRPIFTAYPASFDWTFVYWYFANFHVQSPFGFSGVLDLKTVYAIASGKGLSRSVKRNMPKSLFPDLPHTHHAKDDAIEQGIMGMNLLQWAKDRNLIT